MYTGEIKERKADEECIEVKESIWNSREQMGIEQ